MKVLFQASYHYRTFPTWRDCPCIKSLAFNVSGDGLRCGISRGSELPPRVLLSQQKLFPRVCVAKSISQLLGVEEPDGGGNSRRGLQVVPLQQRQTQSEVMQGEEEGYLILAPGWHLSAPTLSLGSIMSERPCRQTLLSGYCYRNSNSFFIPKSTASLIVKSRSKLRWRCPVKSV